MPCTCPVACFPLDAPPGFMINEVMAQPAESKVSDTSPSFEDLLLAVAHKKDRTAFIALFDHYAPRIKAFLMKGGTPPDAADELAQETMITLWNKAALFDPQKASASTWIFRIARNKRIDAMRRPHPEVALEESGYDMFASQDAAPGEDMDRRRETERMKQALATLPPEQAELIYKSYFEDKSHAAIAAETALPVGTVKSRIRLALDRLRRNQDIKDMRS